MLPSEEVVARTALAFKYIEGLKSLADVFLVIFIFDKGGASSQIDFNHFLPNY